MVTKQLHDITHTHTRLTALFPGLPGWAGTRKVKPIWILLKQQIVSGSGISWATCRSAPRFRQITMPAPDHSVFYRPDALTATQPTASKHWSYTILNYTISCDKNYNNQTETGSVTVMHNLWLWSLYITTHRTTTACTVTKQHTDHVHWRSAECGCHYAVLQEPRKAKVSCAQKNRYTTHHRMLFDTGQWNYTAACHPITGHWIFSKHWP